MMGLPPFLLETDPMEPESLPLQVALLTMQVARLTAILLPGDGSGSVVAPDERGGGDGAGGGDGGA